VTVVIPPASFETCFAFTHTVKHHHVRQLSAPLFHQYFCVEIKAGGHLHSRTQQVNSYSACLF